jgi:hypothetical protein
MENPSDMDDLGVPPFQETSTSTIKIYIQPTCWSYLYQLNDSSNDGMVWLPGLVGSQQDEGCAATAPGTDLGF